LATQRDIVFLNTTAALAIFRTQQRGVKPRPVFLTSGGLARIAKSEIRLLFRTTRHPRIDSFAANATVNKQM
jgi:hypothetical protein